MMRVNKLSYDEFSYPQKGAKNMRKRNKNHASHTIAAGTQVEVAFTLKCADANQAYLCGDFNGWSETSLPMIFRGGGKWKSGSPCLRDDTNTNSLLTRHGPPIRPGRKKSLTPSAPLIRWWRFPVGAAPIKLISRAKFFNRRTGNCP